MRRRSLAVTTFLVLMCWTSPSFADSITVVYDVQLVYRYTYATGGTEYYPQQFELRLTFDPARASPSTGDYGPATFSTVPLHVPSMPGGSVESHSSTSHHSELETEGGTTYRQYARASVTQIAYRNEEFFRILLLESYLTGLPMRSEINAGTFPVHLGMSEGASNWLNGYGNFLYAGYRLSRTGQYTADSYAYYGDAHLTPTQAPVPEPGTLILTGMGIALVIRRRWRRWAAEPMPSYSLSLSADE